MYTRARLCKYANIYVQKYIITSEITLPEKVNYNANLSS